MLWQDIIHDGNFINVNLLVTLKYYFPNIVCQLQERERGAVMYVTSGDVLKSDSDCIEAY